MSGFVQKFKEMWTPPEDEYEYEEMENEEYDEGEEYAEPNAEYNKSSVNPEPKEKVVNLRNSSKLQVVLFKPEKFGQETRAIADELLKMHTVVLNLENAESDVSRRIIDFLSGVAYANNGKIKRVATDTFIITSYNVDMTGEEALESNDSNINYF